MAKGIAVIECRESEPFERHIRPGISPTGRWAVIKSDGLERFLSPDMYESVMRERQLLLPEPLFAKLAEPMRAEVRHKPRWFRWRTSPQRTTQ